MRRMVIVLVAGLCAACTTDVVFQDATGGTGGNGASATGGNGTGASTGEGGAVATCDGFENEPEAPVTIVVDNTSSEPIHIVTQQSTGPGYPFAILDGSGQAVLTGWSTCSCEGLQTSSQACSFNFGGPDYSVLTLMPGGQYELAWDGRIAETVPMAPMCFADQVNMQEACRQHVQAPAGTYTVALDVAVGPLFGCGSGDEECICPPGTLSCQTSTFDVKSDQSATLESAFATGDTSVTLTP